MTHETDDKNFDIKLPFGPPSILPNVTKQLTDYLLCHDKLPIHNFEFSQQYWPREIDNNHLLNFTTAPLATKLKVERDPTTGKLLQFREVAVKNLGNTAKNSMSLNRAPGLFSEGIRGSSSNYPFWPGGFPNLEEDKNTSHSNQKIDFEKDLLIIPPGFSRGVEFLSDGSTPISPTDALESKIVKNENKSLVNLMNVLHEEQALMDNWKDVSKKENKDNNIESLQSQFDLDPEISLDIKADNIPVLNITDPPKKRQIFEWAEEVDVSSPIHNFKDLVPDPAYTWPFELDTFQKQAIIKLEQGDNVFVAAHTSAGKTVVAEYAIALSCRNLTRTIYTSPIKALSNQKFRDFKETFKTILKDTEKEVGLVTGDYQINQNGSCLIMTTEILLSMLYCGSPIIPDLEFVIFDEVHYINDSERGHVWEEVLILLPDHVKIVMLSATVPNTLEFANWVGQTKKRKMYVITTPKRPVPLEHYLYVGSGGKHKQKRFLILDADSRFQLQGYNEAKLLTEGQTKSQRHFVNENVLAKQEKTLWIDFIDHLRKEERLPVVAFTLSRNRCNKNASALSSIDFTTAKEKSTIHHFYEICIQRLKEADQLLPQVIQMRDLLKRGIGIHHSGILPILKEIVEMLFQKGFVKLLFATETFAMGVNMPARTVVFDSIRKFDGLNNRPLNPAEYIQMAGRAGRRGLDTTGTVILLCKNKLPALIELQNIMLGKPDVLTSQFRLSYSMILSLLRVEKISVEGMMTHSFKEVRHFSSQASHKKNLLDVEYQITMSDRNRTHGPHIDDMERFYRTADEYLRIWRELRPFMLAQVGAAKLLVPGSILLITSGNHLNKLGLLLSCDTKPKEPIYKVLVLCNLEAKVKVPTSENMNDDWFKMLALASWRKIFLPEVIGGHIVLNIKSADIFEILYMRPLKINCETILRDWDNRQIPRFRDNPPGQSCASAIQEITQLTMKIREEVPNWADLSRDLPLKNIQIAHNIDSLTILRNELINSSCVKMANFNTQFEEVFHHMDLLKQKENLQYLQSDKALSLYADYESRIKVLQHLKYITKNNTVELKGQVACNIRRHELIITELVFGDILTNLEPPEIAALLSCLVFKNKTINEPILPKSMIKPMEAITKVAEEIEKAERLFDVSQDGVGDEKEIKFGLAQVVYAWAQNEPFSNIMNITDVHEGLIIRCIQQLHETLRDVKEAARHIGNPTVEQKMEHAATIIKRDIIFSPSLYTLQLPQINT